MAADKNAHSDAYEHGSMEIGEQKSTFDLFIGMAKWGSLATAALVLFLAAWFNPNGSFIGAAVATVVLIALGILALKSKPADH